MLTTPLTPSAFPFSQRANAIPVSFVREILKAASMPGMISFAGGLPNPAFFPAEALASAAAAVFKHKAGEVLQYGATEGYLPLRKFISDRYRKRHRIDIPPEHILITNGSQQALDLIGKAFLDPGETVLLERPSYLGAIQSLSVFQPHFSGVNMEHDGICLDDFEEAYWNYNPRLSYCIPDFQNPTGIRYGVEKRLEVARIIRRYATVLVEDDPYGEICFNDDVYGPIKSYNPQQVILLGSFSKTIAPGLRLGWMAAGATIIEKMVRFKQASDLHSSYLPQLILHRYLMENNLDDHLKQVKAFYKSQKEHMVACIRRYFPTTVQLTEPEGGMFLWLTLPEHLDAELLLKEAMQHQVLFVPGAHFYVSEGLRNTIRLNFSNASIAEMEKGMQILGQLLSQVC